jgi:hypothetical protein
MLVGDVGVGGGVGRTRRRQSHRRRRRRSRTFLRYVVCVVVGEDESRVFRVSAQGAMA